MMTKLAGTYLGTPLFFLLILILAFMPRYEIQLRLSSPWRQISVPDAFIYLIVGQNPLAVLTLFRHRESIWTWRSHFI